MIALRDRAGAADAPPAPALPLTPWQLLRRHRGGLLLTYALFVGENILALLQPWLLGLAVQGLTHEEPWLVLAFLAEIMASTVVGRCRRCYDARFFSRIYGGLASRWAVEQRAGGRGLAQVAARSVLARQLVDFLERDLPFVVQVGFQLLGAALLLLLHEPWLLVGCVLAAGGMLLHCPRFARQSQAWNRRWHDQLEREVDVLERADARAVADHYAQLAECQVAQADLQARQFALAQGLTLLLMGFAFWFHTRDPLELGQVVALFGYLSMFSAALLNLSPWLQQCLRLRDVMCRLQEEAPSAPG